MADVISFGQFTNISAVGTTTLSDRGGAVLMSVVMPGTYVGTVTFHDAQGTGGVGTQGTTATSTIITFGLPATAVAGDININARCRYGLMYIATGTPTLTAIWN